jgi:hypothetical protein
MLQSMTGLERTLMFLAGKPVNRTSYPPDYHAPAAGGTENWSPPNCERLAADASPFSG